MTDTARQRTFRFITQAQASMTSQALTSPSSAPFLSVGLPLQLSFADHHGQAQYGASLFGWKAGEWLLCEWPYHLGQPIACQTNEACLVRYMFEGRFIGYPSVILHQQLQPLPFLYLAFPQTVEEVALRRHTRVSLKEPLLIKIEEGGHHYGRPNKRILGGMMHDLSLTGCGVVIEGQASTWGPGTVLRLEFELRGIGHITDLSGVVKNLTESPTHTELGIEFVYTGTEFIEYRGWGGTVRKAIECCVLQKSAV